MNREFMQKYWQEASKLTADLQPGERLSTPQLVEYLNNHLPPDGEPFTKTKVNYLRDQEILHPIEPTEGKERTNWRYSPDDARRALIVLLLKLRENISIKESKWWLRSFEDALLTGGLSIQRSEGSTQERTLPTPPTPVISAYALLRNRILGTLITSLSNGEAEVPPPECLIAVRSIDRFVDPPQMNRLTWNQACPKLEKEKWYLAASDTYLKLYVYTDIKQLQANRPEVENMLPRHDWYIVTLQDDDLCYEAIIGLPDLHAQEPSIVGIHRYLTEKITKNLPLQLTNFPGMATLLKAAFVNQPGIKEQTTLSMLAEIIVSASDAWDHCFILVPDDDERWLFIKAYSSMVPLQLKERHVEIGKSLSGLCYHYRQSMTMEATSENDPRRTFFEEEGHPLAAVAIPAIAEEQRVVGVIYVARSQATESQSLLSSAESLASLKAFGYICGDMIAREQVEIETVRNMTHLSTHSLIPATNLEDLLQRMVDAIQRGVSADKAPHSWLYILTLNIQAASQDTITQWLWEQGIEIAGNFLARRLWDTPHQNPLPVSRCTIGSNQCVFAILQAVDLPEMSYKQKIAHLQEDMNNMHVGRLSPDFYLSAITFRYQEVHQLLKNKGRERLITTMGERMRERLIIGPYLRRGHDALHKSDLDRAVSEFEDALRYTPSSWYGYKHLAEARMLQGTEEAIDQAIETCRVALKLNSDYASAHCLLADCLSYRGRFGEALIEYERALALDNTRPDFLIRYGFALAGMTLLEYQQAFEYVSQQEPVLTNQRTFLNQSWQEAIDKFDRARKLNTMYSNSPEEERGYLVDYRYQRGYVFLQAGSINKAVEDFAVGRKLDPDNLQLTQAYSYALSLRRREKEKSGAGLTEMGQRDFREDEA
jgi:tetratricopeptide (TPR) repeat protein